MAAVLFNVGSLRAGLDEEGKGTDFLPRKKAPSVMTIALTKRPVPAARDQTNRTNPTICR